jgi:anti-sigma-K factor RskA
MNTTASDLERDPPDDDLLAGELVLGVLDGAARRDAQARAEREPAFAGRVTGWERRLGGLLDEIPAEPVPTHVWPRVRTRLGWSPVEGAKPGVWQSLGFWRGLSAVGLAAAAALAIYVMRQAPEALPPPVPTPVVVTPPPLAPVPVVTLAADDGAPAYLASIDTKHARVRVMPVPAAPDSAGRVPELWLIPAGEQPRSLGVIDTAQAREIQIPADLERALVAGSILAITLEPPGGAPAGVPTGPIVAKGGI